MSTIREPSRKCPTTSLSRQMVRKCALGLGMIRMWTKKENALFPNLPNCPKSTHRVQSVPRWMKTLRYSDFSLCGDFGIDDLRDVANVAMLATVPVTTSTDDKKIVVKLKSKGFSKFKHSQEEALSSIGSLFTKLDYIPRDNTRFPTVTWSLHLSEADFDAALLRVTEDIMHRTEVIDRELASEYTMREFISPVLVGALRLVLLFLKKSENFGKLSLICEKVIVGLNAHGPVHYVVVFDYLDIILTEAKKLEIYQGVIQNLLQRRASQDFLTNVLLDYEQIGETALRQLQYAVVRPLDQNGYSRRLCTTNCPKSLQWKSLRSTLYIDLGGAEEDLKEATKPVLSILVRMIMDQIEAVASNTGLAKHGQRTLLRLEDIFNVPALEGNEVVNEINESQVEEE